MKLSEITPASENDYPGENSNFYKLVSFLNNIFVEMSQAFNKRISVDDNLDCLKFEYLFTDLVPVKFKNPGKFKKSEILACNAANELVASCRATYSQENEIIITVKFVTPGAIDKCIVRVI